LDPQQLSSASGNYIMTLIRKGLYRWTGDSKLVPDEGSCSWKSDLELHCRLNEQAFWSDGQPVTATDYRRAFDFLLESKNACPQAHLLFSLKNAEDIYAGKKNPESLGFQVTDAKNFILSFQKPDSEFLYKWVHPALFPRKKEEEKKNQNPLLKPSNGAFHVVQVKKGESFLMERNPALKIPDDKTAVRQVEALIVESDNTTLQLYDAGRVQLARRVPADLFPRYRGMKDFYQFPVLRFDYVGFGPELHPFPQLRKALAQGFDPKGFQKVFSTQGKPGCPSIPDFFHQGDGCFKRASKIPAVKWPQNLTPVLAFSQMGGEDIKRAAEWFQGQWKKNLHVEVELQSREQKVYLNWLATHPPFAFRKGVSLDRPTCLAALEVFRSDHPENYIQFKDKNFDRLLVEMAKTRSEKKLQQLCTKGLDQLIGEAFLIPLGQMEFSILVKPAFTGWEVNSLNQLFLTRLRQTTP
jgi:oligopeptide transport system substrate-binding protein